MIYLYKKCYTCVSKISALPVYLRTLPVYEVLYLCVERELIKFKFLVELAGDATSFEDVGLHVSIEHDREPDVLLQLTRTVVDVQVGIPVSRPVDLFEVLSIRIQLPTSTKQ